MLFPFESDLDKGFAEPFPVVVVPTGALTVTMGDCGAVFIAVEVPLPTNSFTTLPMRVPTPEPHVDMGLGAVGGWVVAEAEG